MDLPTLINVVAITVTVLSIALSLWLFRLSQKGVPLDRRRVRDMLGAVIASAARRDSKQGVQELATALGGEHRAYPIHYVQGVVHATCCLLEAGGPCVLKDRVATKSDLAAAFLGSLRAHLKDDLPLLDGWNDGSQEEHHRWLVACLRRIEETRRDVRGASATPARDLKAVIALIKAQVQDGRRQTVYLMQWSPTWEMWWFIGGIVEPWDEDDLEARMREELKQELDLQPADIAYLQLVAEDIKDARVSQRFGVLTCYRYSVFSVTIRPGSERVARLCRQESEFVTREHGIQYSRRNRWLNWVDITADPQLARNAGPILGEIDKRIDLQGLPISGVEISA